MECQEILKILSDYVDGELSENRCAEIRKHMEECSRCRKFAETFRESLELARKLERKQAPQSVCESVLRAFREARAGKGN
ncbi:MAG: hypothetical protein GXO69_11455 [Acidobacteria bacterium]|nr:hypothetical protein [Acidobacteriota bacterium]